MKLKIFTLFFCCASLVAEAQTLKKSIYAQTIELLQDTSYDATSKMTTVKLSADEITDLTTLLGADPVSVLKSNPFLQGKVIFQMGSTTHAGGTDITGAGALNVTNFANAIASLMIDRAKQELTLAFFNKLSDFSKKYPEFQTLFPKTYDQLRNLLSYSYPQMLPALRTSFFDDIQQLGYNLEAVLELPKYKTLLAKFPEINIAIQTLKLVHKLENGETPPKAINDIDQAVTDIVNGANYNNGGASFRNLVTTIHFANILSTSLENNDVKEVWINATDAKNLISDGMTTRFFLALVYEQIGNLKLCYYKDPNDLTKTVNLQDLLKNDADNILLFQNKIAQFLDQGAKVQKAYDAIRPPLKATPDQYYTFINTSLDAIDFSLSFVKIIDPSLEDDDYLAIARKSNSLYKDIYSKNYTQAVSDGLDVIGSIETLTKYTKKKNKTVKDVTGTYKQESADLFSFINKIRPYALFIANVAEAKTEDDIKSALDNAILPVGSSSIKKNTGGNLSVQTYLGAYFSTHNDNPDAVRAWSDKFGVYGPVGLSYTPGFLSWGKTGSLSLFGSVFDLGAIIDYKLQQDPTATTSTNPATASTSTKSYSVNLGQLFSPGVHAVYGLFGNLPLALGFGAQYGPGLSKISAAGTTSVINPCWRWNAFLVVDLPFFTLYNKPKSGN